MTPINLPKIRRFLIRERLYVWLLIFIISVNMALALSPDKTEKLSGGTFTKAFNETLTRQDLERLVQKNRNLGVLLTVLTFSVLFAIALGLFLDFIIVILKKEGGALLFPSIPHEEPKWGIWDVCKVIILFVWFAYILMFVESALSKIFPIIRTDDNLRSVLNATVTDLLVFVFMIYFVVSEYKQRLASLGFSLKRFLRNVAYGIGGYLAAIPTLLLILLLIIWLSSLFKYKPPMQPVLEIFLEEKKRALVMYLSIFVAIFGPIVEETFFRGFMYKALRKRFGFKSALFSTSALFALLHTNLAGFLPIMVLGMLLAYLFEKTGTLVASCAVHILHNTVMVLFVLAMKGLLQ